MLVVAKFVLCCLLFKQNLKRNDFIIDVTIANQKTLGTNADNHHISHLILFNFAT